MILQLSYFNKLYKEKQALFIKCIGTWIIFNAFVHIKDVDGLNKWFFCKYSCWFWKQLLVF